jgi:hypothetical protein
MKEKLHRLKKNFTHQFKHIICLVLFLSIGIAQSTAQVVPARNNQEQNTYTTVQSGDWKKKSTWKNNKIPPEDIPQGTQVIINHDVHHNKHVRIRFKGNLTIKDATLTLKKGNVQLQGALGVLHIEKGALILDRGHVHNQKGMVQLKNGGIQICRGHYADHTRSNGGTFGIGFIYASNGNIRNIHQGGFSSRIQWCAPNGMGMGMITESECEIFAPLTEGNCNDPFFYLTFFDYDQDGVTDAMDIDNDNDGIADVLESNGFDAFGDEDGDGVLNYLDTVDNGNMGDSSQTDYTDVNGDNVPDVFDTDLDGVVNFRDLDSDNDGIPDTIEAQPTSQYLFASIFIDANENGMNDVYEGEDGSFLITPSDVDDDGTPDFLDLDSDGDGMFDLVESGSELLDADHDGRIDGNTGSNGLLDSFELNDSYMDNNGNFDNSQTDNFPDADNDINLGGEVDYKDNEFTQLPMITQVYHSPTDRWIEITNPSQNNTIPSNSITVTLYNSSLEELSSVAPISYQIKGSVEPKRSILISNPTALITQTSGSVEAHNLVTAFGPENTIVLSAESGSSAWETRYDVVSSIENNTSYVRIDFDDSPSRTFVPENWIPFVDEMSLLETISNGGKGHPNDPLLSEIRTANDKANIKLGEHRFGVTERINGTWNNGYPDRTREVIVSEDYEHILERLSARTLEVQNGSKLVVNSQALIVTNQVHINGAADEIRLAGTSQLVQTHSGQDQVTGEGKLYIDRDTNLKSIYRFNYLSSPVHNGNKTYSVAGVLKDGTEPTSLFSTPKEINFVDGFDSAPTSPISIADYWIFSFGMINGVSNWIQERKDGLISATDGFLMKGPGTWQNYTYVGTPNDGILTTEVSGSQSYFLGNPYPSAINAKKFIQDNLDAINGTLYFWDHVGDEDTSTQTSGHNYGGYIGGYAIINLSMSLAANSPLNPAVNVNNILSGEDYKQPRPYIAVGQGFFAAGDLDGGTITFKNSQRAFVIEGDESVFFKNSNEPVKYEDEIVSKDLPVLKLGMDYTDRNGVNLHRQIGISFSPKNSFLHDKGYDSPINDLGDTDLYWKFPNNDHKYIIAGVESIHTQLKIPFELMIDTSSEDIRFTIDRLQNIDEELYIYDQWKNTYYSLRENEATMNIPSGNYTDRFFLTFTKNAQDEAILSSSFTKIYADQSRGEVVVRLPEETTIEQVFVYNILGKEIRRWTSFDQKTEQRLPTDQLSGFYLVKVKTNKNVITKKILLQ